MKRIVLVLIATLISVLAVAQEREVKKVELKNGSSVTGYVQAQEDGSYLVETTTGDIFYYTSAEIKSITSEKIVSSQPESYNVGNDNERLLVYKKGGKLRLKDTGLPLEQSYFANYEGWDRYRGAQKMRNTGTLLIVLGTIVEAGSLISYGVLDGEYFDYYNSHPEGVAKSETEYWGFNVDLIPIFGCSSGGVALISGVLLNIVGNKRLVKIAKGINNGTGYELTFGAQPHGVGLALNF